MQLTKLKITKKLSGSNRTQSKQVKHISYNLFNDSKRISSVQLCITCTCMCKYGVTGEVSIIYVLVAWVVGGADRNPSLVTCCCWKWDIIIILKGSVIILTVITCDMSTLSCNWQETVLLLIMMQYVICQPIDELRHIMADTHPTCTGNPYSICGVTPSQLYRCMWC